MARSIVGAATGLSLAMIVAGGAQAQLIHRHNDGSISVNPLLCQTDYEVRKAIAARGFTHIFLNAPVNDVIRARADKGGTTYLIDYNYCLGRRIVAIQPLRRAR